MTKFPNSPDSSDSPESADAAGVSAARPVTASGPASQRPAEDPTADALPADAEGDAVGPVPRGHSRFREPPEPTVKAAKVAPNHLLSIIDRHWDGTEGEPPPPWAIMGRWRSDAHGEIVEWEENPRYRPSPDAYGWGPALSPADAAVRLVATRYESRKLLALVLADTELAVCVDAEGGLAEAETPDGLPVVPVFPDASSLDGKRLPPYELMTVPDLLDRLPDDRDVLFLSSSAPAAQILTADELRTGLADFQRVEDLDQLDAETAPGTGLPAADSKDLADPEASRALTDVTDLPGLDHLTDLPGPADPADLDHLTDLPELPDLDRLFREIWGESLTNTNTNEDTNEDSSTNEDGDGKANGPTVSGPGTA
ncbi:type VII secretion system-associated protein [Streptomyces sp. NPDC004726]